MPKQLKIVTPLSFVSCFQHPWPWWWATFWSLLTTCLLWLFPPSSSCASPIKSHKEFSPGPRLVWRFYMSPCWGVSMAFCLCTAFLVNLQNQIQLVFFMLVSRIICSRPCFCAKKCSWSFSLNSPFVSSSSSWLKQLFLLLMKAMTLYCWRLCAVLHFSIAVDYHLAFHSRCDLGFHV